MFSFKNNFFLIFFLLMQKEIRTSLKLLYEDVLKSFNSLQACGVFMVYFYKDSLNTKELLNFIVFSEDLSCKNIINLLRRSVDNSYKRTYKVGLHVTGFDISRNISQYELKRIRLTHILNKIKLGNFTLGSIS